MKLSTDSTELTAYVLNELPPDQRAVVERAIAASPELTAEVELLESTARSLVNQFASEPVVALEPKQREQIVARHDLQAAVSRGASATNRYRTRFMDLWSAAANRWAWVTATAVTAVIALALFLPRESADRQFASLRYQRLPSTPQPTALAPAAVSSTAGKDIADLGALPAGSNNRKLDQLETSLIGADPFEKEEILTEAASDRAAALDPLQARRFGIAPGDSGSARGTDAKPTAVGDESKDQTRSALTEVRLGFLGEESTRELLERPRSKAPVPALLFKGEKFFFRAETALDSDTERYAPIPEQVPQSPLIAPLSTFSLDVDTASYSNTRRFLRGGSLPPADAVRIEELINYFHYDYPAPRGSQPFGAAIEISDCPWRAGSRLVRIGLQATSIGPAERPRANLVFLLDVSGSMEPENKLPLVKRSLRLLLDRLGERDAVSIVTYAGESRIALEPTVVGDSGRRQIGDVIEGLRAGSGTAGSAGIQSAYTLAARHFIPGGVNRVILCTDGDFNIGITDAGELHRLIEDKAKSGVFLSVLGYGMGNTKDSTMELLADKGNGNYAYVDSFAEARKVLGDQLEGTLVTVAKDVKVQVEFNPGRVRSYRLIGYENRRLRDRDFNDDTKDAGEVGSGHQVTVLYEIEPMAANSAGTDPLRYRTTPGPEAAAPSLKPGHGDELLNLKIRYKAPNGDQSRLIEIPVKDEPMELSQAGKDFKFASAVAGYGLLLRNSTHRGDLTWEAVLRLAEQGMGTDKEGYRAEFIDLVRKAQQLSGGK